MSYDYLKHITAGLDKEHTLQELMGDYAKDVWKYAYFLTLRHDAADDITQDVFLRAYKNMYQFRGQSSIKTWLFSIARHTTRDYLKSYWVRRIVLFGDRQPVTSVRSAEDEALRSFERDHVWKEVLALPKDLREVLVLQAHHGLPIKEIASLLRVSESVVKTRLHRARSKVINKVKED